MSDQCVGFGTYYFVIRSQQMHYGSYHATCKGLCSRYDFAREILSLAGLHAEVKEISIADSKEHLVRPAYAVLDNFILRIIDVYEMPKWKQSLRGIRCRVEGGDS